MTDYSKQPSEKDTFFFCWQSKTTFSKCCVLLMCSLPGKWLLGREARGKVKGEEGERREWVVLLFVHLYGRVINVIVCGGENCELEISFKTYFGFWLGCRRQVWIQVRIYFGSSLWANTISGVCLDQDACQPSCCCAVVCCLSMEKVRGDTEPSYTCKTRCQSPPLPFY